MSAGTQGWHTCEALTKRRMGIPGPGGLGTTDGAPFVVAVKVRPEGRHKGHRSYSEYDAQLGGWMLLVLDERRNIVGQVFARTHAACERKMNDVFAAKGLGVYSGTRKPASAPATSSVK